MDYPSLFFRGISNSTQIDSDGHVCSSLFDFKNCSRTDCFEELSILWNDDDGAKEKILNQRKSDTTELQFKVGYVIMEKSHLDRLKNLRNYLGSLSYERAPLENNEYHGNILLSANLQKSARRIMLGALAADYVRIEYRENNE